jgi:hypothetical protein
MFFFDVDRLSGYDHELNSLLSIKADDFFSLPCVRLIFENDEIAKPAQEEDSIALIFMKSKENSIENYRIIFSFFRSIIDGKLTTKAMDKNWRKKVNAFLELYKDFLGNAGFFLTYSLFDLLMIVKINNITIFPEFIVALRNLLEEYISDTSTIIGYSKQYAFPQEGKNPVAITQGKVNAEIKIKIENGQEYAALSHISTFLRKENYNPNFSWQYGDYDLTCNLSIDSLESLHKVVIDEIRNIHGVIRTATCLNIATIDKEKPKEPHNSVKSCPIGKQRFVKDAFRERRDIIYQQIKTEKVGKKPEQTLFLERKNRQFSQLEQILYRLRYIGFRWQRYQKYLPSISVFDQMELKLLDCFDELGKSAFWDDLSKIDDRITDIHRIVTSLEKGFHQRLESLDMMLLSNVQAKGIEKLGSFEKVMEAMDAVANDYISISGDNWRGLVVAGIWNEEFQADTGVDLIYVPTYSKYRMKTWPLIAHEVGHHIDYRFKEKGNIDELHSLVEEYQLLFTDYSGLQIDIDRVSSEILADILATYSAGTSYIRMLVEHMYSPPYFFDVNLQDLSCNKGLVPMPLRILICSAVLGKISGELSRLVEDIQTLSEAAIHAEELRFKEYIDNLESLAEITGKVENIKNVPFRNEIENTFRTYVEISRLRIEKVRRSLKRNEVQSEIGFLLNELTDNLLIFCEISGLYKRQLSSMISDLKFRQTLLKQSSEFVSRLQKNRANNTSILDDVLGLLKPSPFYASEYSISNALLRQALGQGQLVSARPSLILETVIADKKGELNENAAIFSMLLYNQKSPI